MKNNILLLLCVFYVGLANAQQFSADNIQSIVDKLTIEEKVKVVIGAGMNFGNQGAAVGQTEEKVPGAAGTSQKIERLGLEKVVFADGPAGVRISPERKNHPDQTFYATAFPVATLMSSSFNLELMEKVGKAFGNETKEYGVDILLAPALNIHRNPLTGRNFEYYSEDPLLSGKMAAAFVNGVQSQGVGTSIKHFAANNQETNRTKINTVVSQRALREIYLKGFEIAVKESNPWTVMSAYNKINATFASENHDLLTTILRDEWGFKGFVMTDWFAGTNPAEQMIAGNDLLMPGTPDQEQQLLTALKNGELEESVLDKNVTAILNIYAKTPTFQGYKVSNKPDMEKHKTIAKEAATEGMVLLKNNDQALPIQKGAGSVALFDNGSYTTVSGGTGSNDVNKAYSVPITEGIQKQGFKLSGKMQEAYLAYIKAEKDKAGKKQFFFEPDKKVPEMDWETKKLDSIAEVSAVGIFTLTRTSGEFYDREEKDDFLLTANESQLIRKLYNAFHSKGKKFVILLNIGGVIETSSWRDFADAILLVWQPGQEGGTAVAEVLSGEVNPSGKLPMTFPVRYNDVLSSENFPGKELEANENPNPFMGVNSEVIYEEDIFVGYRYFETFDKNVSFPFGFGMSYTNFSFSDLVASKQKDGRVNVTFKVKNTGNTAGKEVCQLYVSSPEGKLIKPAKELKAFAKTSLLKPGGEEKISFTLTPYELSSYDTESSSWIMEKGDYTLMVGSSIKDLPLTSKINQKSTETVMKTNNVLQPDRAMNLKKPN